MVSTINSAYRKRVESAADFNCTCCIAVANNCAAAKIDDMRATSTTMRAIMTTTTQRQRIGFTFFGAVVCLCVGTAPFAQRYTLQCHVAIKTTRLPVWLYNCLFAWSVSSQMQQRVQQRSDGSLRCGWLVSLRQI